MEWLKKGKIDYSRWKHINKYASDFATLPTPIVINNEIIRIFIGFCDENNVGTISYLDVLAVSKDSGESFSKISSVPILDRREDELFARCGMYVTNAINEEFKMWYIGTFRGGWTQNGNSLKP